MRKKLVGLGVAMMMCGGVAHAGLLTLEYTNTIDNQLAYSNTNFHPQGLGYDTGSDELLFMQQGSSTIYRTDLTGSITGSRDIEVIYKPNDQLSVSSHATSVAGDGTNYYYSDYTGNANSYDLYITDKVTGTATYASSEIAAYGGYPIDVRNGNLYRTENTTNYSWGSLTDIRISSLSSIDTILQTVSLATSSGIGDIAVDSSRNNIWTIDYAAGASIRQFDLATGNELSSFSLGLDGLTGGLTYANDTLYYYDWNLNNGSTLSAFSMSGFDGGNASVPEPNTLLLFGTGLVALAGVNRRRKK